MSGRVRSKNLPTWMRIALHSWDPPRDPTINYVLEADFSEATPWLEKLSAENGVKVTATALVIKAFGAMVAEVQELNVAVVGRKVYRRKTIDATVMVEVTERKNDLAVVTVKDVDRRSIVDIARDITTYHRTVKPRGDSTIAQLNKGVALIPDALLGAALRGASSTLAYLQHGLGIDLERFGVPGTTIGSFFVSNVGALGLDAGFAPFHPVLGIPMGIVMGMVTDRPWVVDGQLQVRPVIRLGLNCDHRVISPRNMAVGAKRVKDGIEHPSQHLN